MKVAFLSRGRPALRCLAQLCLPVLLFAVASCGGDGSGPTDPDPDLTRVPATITIHAGADQSSVAGSAVPTAPAVLVRNSTGSPIQGVSVQFTVAAGGGQVTGGASTTDASGVAQVQSWVLGTGGEQRLTARVANLPLVTFEATVEAEATISVAAAGGTVRIDEAGHPYDGLTLTIPAGAFPQGSAWSLRVDEDAPTLSLPTGFTVAGPTLEVRTSAVRTGTLMTLDLPVQDAAAKAIVIAVRDPARGIMEVLPTVAVSPTSIRVMAGHLRGDLLLGPAGSGATPVRSLPARGIAADRQPSYDIGGGLPGIAQLIPIEMLLPTLPASSEINRWPILDHGSAEFPQGFGPAISALEVSGSARGLRPFSAAVRGLDIPGFYAESGPLAALAQANRSIAESVASVGRQLSEALSELPKAQQDEIVHRNVLANIRLSNSPTLVAAVREMHATSAVIGAAIQGTTEHLILTVPTSAEPVTLPRQSGGFLSIGIASVVGATPIDLNSIIPLTSLVTPFEQIGNLAESVSRIGEQVVGSAARRQLNEELAREAGLALPTVEFRADAEAEWRPVTDGSFFARSREALIRVAGSTASLHGTNGDRIGEGTEIALELDGALFDGGSGPVARSVSTAVAGIGGLIRQVGAVTVRITGALFALEESQVRLEPGELEVEFTAKVPSPPAGGYRILWDWGDGTTTETANTLGAVHEYEAAADYTVTVTLLDMEGGRLARTTGQVSAAASLTWRITSFADQDDLFGDEDIEGSGPAVELLRRLLAAPTAGLITIEPGESAGTRLMLRAHRTTVWSGSGVAPPPSSAQAEHLLMLGTDPPTLHSVGPFFAGWESDYWTQTTADPTAGSMTGRYALGHATYQIEDAGTQRGPAGGVRFAGERNGARLTGTVIVVIWWQDEETGEVSEPAEEFRFGFEALRWGAAGP